MENINKEDKIKFALSANVSSKYGSLWRITYKWEDEHKRKVELCRIHFNKLRLNDTFSIIETNYCFFLTADRLGSVGVEAVVCRGYNKTFKNVCSSFFFFVVVAIGALVGLTACGGIASRNTHYDTTRVDTIKAVCLDSLPLSSQKASQGWLLSEDSIHSKLYSQMQQGSNITPYSRLCIVKSRYKAPTLSLQLSYGERFAADDGEAFATIRLLSHGKEIGVFRGKIAENGSRLFIPNTFLKAIYNKEKFAVELNTVASGKLIYKFRA